VVAPSLTEISVTLAAHPHDMFNTGYKMLSEIGCLGIVRITQSLNVAAVPFS